MYNNDMYQTFSSSNVTYDATFTFKNQNKDYLVPNNKAKYSWNYGNTVSLVFIFPNFLNTLDSIDTRNFHWNTSTDINTTITIPLSNTIWNSATETVDGDFNFIVTFYNFRFEQVYQDEVAIDDEDGIVIDAETSSSVFLKGVYYCGVDVEYDDDKVFSIVPPEQCLIYVN